MITQITPEAVGAAAAALTATATAAGLYIRWMVRAALSEFKADLIEDLSCKFVRREEWQLHLQEMARKEAK